MIPANQIASMLASALTSAGDEQVSGEWDARVRLPGGDVVTIEHCSRYISISLLMGAAHDGSERRLYFGMEIPLGRPDLIPWAVEQVSAIVLQARAHGVP